MSEKCTACGQDLPAVDPNDLDALRTRLLMPVPSDFNGALSMLSGWNPGYSLFVPALGAITLIEEIRPESDSYGDSSGDIKIIFDFNGTVYIFEAYQDSYADVTWRNGTLRLAQKRTITQTVWE